ncbi:MAG: DNA integrity scanning protein DisA nucleotide-binding domain protein [Bacteroidetes bacterium]|nr:DNA integrity scanning protein DisA nucleotide-binding domain protein [Bacteroidota bacterium]
MERRLGNLAQIDLDPIIIACERMAQQYTGAIIIIARRNELQTFVATGEVIDGRISSQLLENIFFKNSPLHDGAVIILENRIKAARCILPVSDTTQLSADMGLRHRAAVGITEQTDAVAIVVSEQTGRISVCVGGTLHKGLTRKELSEVLDREFRQKA